jgi:CBS domain-containing protein
MPILAKDLMWSEAPLIDPQTPLKEAAQLMIDVDAGVLPVGQNGRIEGIITDRDIVIRAVANGKDSESEKVSDYMTANIYSCKEKDTVRDAAEVMKEKGVSRLAVINDQGWFTGILSFGHIFRDDATAEEATDIITRVADRNIREKGVAVTG